MKMTGMLVQINDHERLELYPVHKRPTGLPLGYDSKNVGIEVHHEITGSTGERTTNMFFLSHDQSLELWGALADTLTQAHKMADAASAS